MAKSVDIVGVVGPNGTGGRVLAKKVWFVTFMLEKWRRKNAALEQSRMHVKLDGSPARLKAFQSQVSAYDVISASIQFIPDEPGYISPRARLLRFGGKTNADTELNMYATNMQKPLILKDSFFGSLTYNRDVRSFEGHARWNGKRVPISLHEAPDAALEPFAIFASTLWKAQKKWHRRILDCAVKKLLPLKNRAWLEEDEKPLSAMQFKRAINVNGISLFKNGDFQIWLDDAEFFGGHSLRVSGSIKKGPTGADMLG